RTFPFMSVTTIASVVESSVACIIESERASSLVLRSSASFARISSGSEALPGRERAAPDFFFHRRLTDAEGERLLFARLECFFIKRPHDSSVHLICHSSLFLRAREKDLTAIFQIKAFTAIRLFEKTFHLLRSR